MPIISQTTWDKFTQEEKEAIREFYKGTESDILKTEYKELFGKENLQPKPKEYWEIEEELFNHRANQWLSYYIIDWDKPHSTATQIVKSDCTSHNQAEKLLAINKLLNVAKFLNKDLEA